MALRPFLSLVKFFDKIGLSARRPFCATLLIITLPLFLTACGTGKMPDLFGQITSINSTPEITTGSILPVARWDRHDDGKTWTRYTATALNNYGQGLISSAPKDVAQYCPSYAGLQPQQRRAFWIHLISALSKYESNFDPSVKFDETTVDPKMITVSGQPIISRGLLQISKESANGYGCKINEASQLHDANTNLSCAVRILDRWITRDGVISGQVDAGWRGAARYFSPFRDDNKRQAMQTLSQNLSFCR